MHFSVYAEIIKTIDFENETVGELPSFSFSDSTMLNELRFGDPKIREEDGNKYLELNASDNGGASPYDQVIVSRSNYTDTLQFSFDLKVSEQATFFFDIPNIQRYDFYATGIITAENIDPTSRRFEGCCVRYDNIYEASHDVGTLFDLSQWNNYLFDVNYLDQLVDVYINNQFMFSDTIFSDLRSDNRMRFTSNSGPFGIDNINILTNTGTFSSVNEPPMIMLLFGALAIVAGALRRRP
ncbi:hypothetical protein [Glaciecola sp. 1036]|uniref:hypothetical protein n=1 Tax=Alteromonadaceae TaxID=72275 RepID=UPI003D06724E